MSVDRIWQRDRYQILERDDACREAVRPPLTWADAKIDLAADAQASALNGGEGDALATLPAISPARKQDLNENFDFGVPSMARLMTTPSVSTTRKVQFRLRQAVSLPIRRNEFVTDELCESLRQATGDLIAAETTVINIDPVAQAVFDPEQAMYLASGVLGDDRQSPRCSSTR